MYSFAFIGGRGLGSDYGGVENAIREICREAPGLDRHVYVYGVEGGHVSDNVSSINIPDSIYRYFGQYGLVFFSVIHCIFFLRPDCVFVFASGPNVFTPILRVFGIPVISSLRAIDSARDKWGWKSKTILRVGEYFAARFANVFTSNSKNIVEKYVAKGYDAEYIPNGADSHRVEQKVDLITGLQDRGYILFAARLDPVKRLHLLLEAYCSIEDDTKPHLVIAGGNCKDTSYQTELYKYKSNNVHFLGHVSEYNVNYLMRNCSLFVLPSVVEGMSNSLLTAIYYKKSVLVSDIAENTELVSIPELTFKADDLSDLKSRLLYFVRHPDYFFNKSQLNSENVKQEFVWAKTASLFFSAANRVLK